MKNKDKHQSLARWLSGDATFADEKELDQAGQEDDFLAEAMSGYRALPKENHLERVTKLKAKLRKKSGRKPAFVLMRVAAAVIFLVGAIFVLNNLNNQTTQTISQVEKTESVENIAPETNENDADIAFDKVEDEAPIIKENDTPKEQKKQAPKKKTPPPPINKPQLAEQTPPQKKAEESTLSEKPKIIEEEEKEKSAFNAPNIAPPISQSAPAKDISVPENRNVEEIAEMEMSEFDLPEPQIIDLADKNPGGTGSVEDTQILKNVSGFIRDENGNPIGGATIFATNISGSTITNVDGSFNLRVDSRIDQLRISHERHAPLAIELSGENYVEAALSDLKNSKEQTKVSAKKSRAQSLDNSADFYPNSSSNLSKAAPVIGFPKFEKYIEQNLKYPDEALKNNVRGIVQVQFKVNKDGTLSDFKVRKKLGYGCDEEAIRVLKSGPKWAAQLETITIYSVEFKSW